MASRISDRDIEIISAYLDGQLSKGERAHLEARLQTEPKLREILEQMQRTRTMLRSLPKLRAPRNYTLSPSMATSRPPSFNFYPVLRFATVLTVFLFVLALVGDMLFVPSPTSVTMVASPVMETPVMLMEAPAQEVQPFSESTPAAEPTLQADQESLKAEGAAEPESQQLALESGLMTPTPQPTQEVAAAITGEEAPAPESLKSLGEESAAAAVEEVPRQPRLESWFVLRVIEVFLAIFAVMMGLAAIYFRKKQADLLRRR